MRQPPPFKNFPAALAKMAPLGTWRAVVAGVPYDGDTFDAWVWLGFRKWAFDTVRLEGFDAEEMRGGTPETRARAVQAQKLLQLLLPDGTPVVLQCAPDPRTFGRYVARVHLEDGREVAEQMQASGLAKGV